MTTPPPAPPTTPMSTRTAAPVRLPPDLREAAAQAAAKAGQTLPVWLAEAAIARLRVEAPELADGLIPPRRPGRPWPKPPAV